jgi:hypothetical protein
MTGLCQCRADRNARSSQCPLPLGATRIFHLICGTCRAGSSYIHTSLYTHRLGIISSGESTSNWNSLSLGSRGIILPTRPTLKNLLRRVALLLDSSISCILFCCVSIPRAQLHAFIVIGRFYLSFSFGEVVGGTRALRLDLQICPYYQAMSRNSRGGGSAKHSLDLIPQKNRNGMTTSTASKLR